MRSLLFLSTIYAASHVFALPVSIRTGNIPELMSDPEPVYPLGHIDLSGLNEHVRNISTACGNDIAADFIDPVAAKYIPHNPIFEAECLDAIYREYRHVEPYIKNLSISIFDDINLNAFERLSLRRPKMNELKLMLGAFNEQDQERIIDALMKFEFSRLELDIPNLEEFTAIDPVLQVHPTMTDLDIFMSLYDDDKETREFIESTIHNVFKNDRLKKFTINADFVNGVAWPKLNPNLEEISVTALYSGNDFTPSLINTPNLKALAIDVNCAEVHPDFQFSRFPSDFSFKGLKSLKICGVPTLRDDWTRIIEAKDTLEELSLITGGSNQFFSEFFHDNHVLKTFRINGVNEFLSELLSESRVTTLQLYHSEYLDITYILENSMYLEEIILSNFPYNLDSILQSLVGSERLIKITDYGQQIINKSYVGYLENLMLVKPEFSINGYPIRDVIERLKQVDVLYVNNLGQDLRYFVI